MWVLVLQKILIEAILDIVYFPIWWYTGGAKHALVGCFGLLREGNAMFAPGLWLKNIFVPMFGQHDWQGRIISFFMRVAQIIFRTIILIIWLGVCIVLFLLWLVFPIAVVYGLIYSIKMK